MGAAQQLNDMTPIKKKLISRAVARERKGYAWVTAEEGEQRPEKGEESREIRSRLIRGTDRLVSGITGGKNMTLLPENPPNVAEPREEGLKKKDGAKWVQPICSKKQNPKSPSVSGKKNAASCRVRGGN